MVKLRNSFPEIYLKYQNLNLVINSSGIMALVSVMATEFCHCIAQVSVDKRYKRDHAITLPIQVGRRQIAHPLYTRKIISQAGVSAQLPLFHIYFPA